MGVLHGPLHPEEVKARYLPAHSLEGNLTVGLYIHEGGKRHFIMETLTQMLTLAIWHRGRPSSCEAQTEEAWHSPRVEIPSEELEEFARPKGFC